MINFVFQNENFVVCDKPALMLSVPAREKDDLRPCLGTALQAQLGVQVFPVHRLDYEVSGLILYALNSRSHKESQKWFLQKKIQKKYFAETNHQNFAHWPVEIATDRSEILPHLHQKLKWKCQLKRGKKRSYESPHGEWSETHAMVTRITDEKLEWNLFPLTGKPHQLRFELSRHGFPIIGDSLYGSTAQYDRPGIALKATELDLSNIENRLGLPLVLQQIKL